MTVRLSLHLCIKFLFSLLLLFICVPSSGVFTMTSSSSYAAEGLWDMASQEVGEYGEDDEDEDDEDDEEDEEDEDDEDEGEDNEYSDDDDRRY